MASASTTNMDMNLARLFLDNHSFSSSDLGIPKLKLSGDSIFSDQDLLTLILVRVPLKKLTQFKCVSKSWLFLISSPFFSNLRCCMLPLPPRFGLFFQSSLIGNRLGRLQKDQVYCFPVQDGYNDDHDNKAPVFNHDLFGHRGHRTRILDSSHGLLLCASYFWTPQIEREHYIYNPTTNELATLPRPSHQSLICSLSMVLAFRSSDSPHYKIIACAKIPQETPRDVPNSFLIMQFEIYSSETRSWRVCGQPFVSLSFFKFTQGVYCNGSVYYPNALQSEEEESAESSDCLYFNLEDERLHTFPTPPIATTRSLRRSFYFGESDDHLHFVEVCPYAAVLHVHEMNCDHSGWFVKYLVDLAPLCKTFPQCGDEYLVAVLSIVRRDKFQEDDSFLVLGTCDEVVSYNLVNRSLKKMFDLEEVFDQASMLRHKNLKAWQYVEGNLSV
ncbi:F-box domain-containing protein [Heracleum sosnowskyi]|uniref:F-box domain-containing protein n=1 Tax=Heracleum sosnowskyi TaxID=360622 RepID=A0AAD8MFM2_9APIA|nr:F-box domain-containing protein [Heracleum sosnowskyi]